MPPSDNRTPAGPGRVIQVPLGGTTIELQVPARAPVEEDPQRLTLWWGVTCAAIALARRLLAGPPLDGLRVVELGCGVGLAGIAAGLRGAQVTFTDLREDALRHALANARANGIPAARLATAPLDWQRPPAELRADLVLGAEIAYDYWVHDALLSLLPTLIDGGGRVLLADRRRLVVDRLIGRLRHAGLACALEEQRIALDGFPDQRITLFELSREVR